MSSKERQMTDEEIIELFNRRDEAGIGAMIGKYGKLLKSVGLRFLPDSRDVEECMNDTVLHLWNAIPPADPENLRAYLVTSFRRTVISRARMNHSKKRAAILSELSWEACENEEVASKAIPGPEEAIERLDLKEAINSFVDQLPERSRFLFVGRYYMGQSVRELAALLNVSKSLVSLELGKIRKAMEEWLKKRESGV